MLHDTVQPLAQFVGPLLWQSATARFAELDFSVIRESCDRLYVALSLLATPCMAEVATGHTDTLTDMHTRSLTPPTHTNPHKASVASLSFHNQSVIANFMKFGVHLFTVYRDHFFSMILLSNVGASKIVQTLLCMQLCKVISYHTHPKLFGQ
jgi:hypothetical protein